MAVYATLVPVFKGKNTIENGFQAFVDAIYQRDLLSIVAEA